MQNRQVHTAVIKALGDREKDLSKRARRRLRRAVKAEVEWGFGHPVKKG